MLYCPKMRRIKFRKGERIFMKKILLVLMLTIFTAIAGMADTLYLKNGSVLKGTFVGYENGQFIFELPNGNQLRFRPAEVTRLVIDRESTPAPPDTNAPSTGGRWESFPAVDVRLEEQWIKTNIMLSRGNRVRVEASGTITLEGKNQTGPEGLQNRRDPDAPLPDENDGALVAIIGQDPNAPAVLVGRSREFTAEQDGVLYFTVNHWETRNARGSFRVNVSIDRSSVATGTGGTPRQREKVVTVNANQPWTDTGIDVEPNMSFEIVAEGTIEISSRYTSGPEGNPNAAAANSVFPIQDEGPGALIAKIRYRDGRDSNYVFIGARSTPAAEQGEYGRLFLGINDDFFRDNKGAFTVRIRW